MLAEAKYVLPRAQIAVWICQVVCLSVPKRGAGQAGGECNSKFDAAFKSYALPLRIVLPKANVAQLVLTG